MPSLLISKSFSQPGPALTVESRETCLSAHPPVLSQKVCLSPSSFLSPILALWTSHSLGLFNPDSDIHDSLVAAKSEFLALCWEVRFCFYFGR